MSQSVTRVAFVAAIAVAGGTVPAHAMKKASNATSTGRTRLDIRVTEIGSFPQVVVRQHPGRLIYLGKGSLKARSIQTAAPPSEKKQEKREVKKQPAKIGEAGGAGAGGGGQGSSAPAAVVTRQISRPTPSPAPAAPIPARTTQPAAARSQEDQQLDRELRLELKTFQDARAFLDQRPIATINLLDPLELHPAARLIRGNKRAAHIIGAATNHATDHEDIPPLLAYKLLKHAVSKLQTKRAFALSAQRREIDAYLQVMDSVKDLVKLRVQFGNTSVKLSLNRKGKPQDLLLVNYPWLRQIMSEQLPYYLQRHGHTAPAANVNSWIDDRIRHLQSLITPPPTITRPAAPPVPQHAYDAQRSAKPKLTVDLNISFDAIGNPLTRITTPSLRPVLTVASGHHF